MPYEEHNLRLFRLERVSRRGVMTKVCKIMKTIDTMNAELLFTKSYILNLD